MSLRLKAASSVSNGVYMFLYLLLQGKYCAARLTRVLEEKPDSLGVPDETSLVGRHCTVQVDQL